MKRMIQQIMSGARRGLFALALIVFSDCTFSQTTFTFTHTGAMQTLTLQAGSYSMQCWGAKGETAVNQPTGGIGGYSAGTFSVTSATTVHIAVGGKGSLGSTTAAFANGGFNGGGQGYGSTTIGAGGGGASHIATATGVLSSLSTNTTAVLIVAGGGGGSGWAGVGGNGGGAVGGNGNSGLGGSTGGTFGQGANGTTAGTCGGGGGGWFGGNLGSPGNTGGAGGGSGYIGGVTNGITVQPGQTGFITNPDVSGHGLVIITELCSVKIASSSGTVNPVSLCSGSSLTLTTDAVSNYSWSTGATSSSIVVTPTSNTVISVTATSSMNCTSTGVMNIIVSSGLPVLSISNPSSNICLGRTVSLTASGALSYTWTNPGVVNGQTFAPTSTAAYTVTGQNGCGTSMATTTIVVAPLSVAASASPALVCMGYPTTLSAVAAVNNFTWQPNAPGSGSVIAVIPTGNTIYTVTASDGTCAGTQTIQVTTKITPTITTTQTLTNICKGQSVTLTANGAGAGGSYSWTPGGPGSSIVLSPSSSTIVSVAGTNSLNCTAVAQQILLVDLPPTLTVSASSTLVCSGSSVVLTGSGANNYTWTNGPSSAGYTIHPTTALTVYTVTGTHTANACAAEQTIAIAAIVPNVAFSSSLTVCQGGSVTFTASGATSYAWNGVNTGSSGSYQTIPPASGTYTLVSTTSSFNVNCFRTDFSTVTVNPNPTVSVSPAKQTICKGETHVLTASGATSYSWGAQGSGSVISVQPLTTTSYSVTGTDANGCEHTVFYSAKVNACNGIYELTDKSAINVYPNPSNGNFVVSAEKEIQLSVINEMGQQVALLKISAENGYKAEVKDLPAGVYFLTGISDALRINEKIVVTR